MEFTLPHSVPTADGATMDTSLPQIVFQLIEMVKTLSEQLKWVESKVSRNESEENGGTNRNFQQHQTSGEQNIAKKKTQSIPSVG